MIHPNMCTMLGFVTTDAAISKELLQEALREDVKDTFNMVSVDGDTSTNDTLLVLANGMAASISNCTAASLDAVSVVIMASAAIPAASLPSDLIRARSSIPAVIFSMEALKREKISKVSLIAFTKNDVGNAFWNRIGWTKREDLNYYDFVLNKENIVAFNQ